MISTDAKHLPIAPREVWIPGFTSNLASGWQVIIIPKEAQMLWFTAIAGGGGGARPNAAAATAGGGGGSSGSFTHIMIAASVLPNKIFASVGLGGAGATANNTAGAAGIATYLSCVPSVNDEDTIIYANGGNGGAAAGGAGSGRWSRSGNSSGTSTWRPPSATRSSREPRCRLRPRKQTGPEKGPTRCCPNCRRQIAWKNRAAFES